MEDGKCLQRMLKYMKKRMVELRLQDVEDRRRAQGKRWGLPKLLSATLLGLMGGCQSLAELERLTCWSGTELRRRFRLPRRVPDTTLRDTLCKAKVESLRALLHRAVRKAWRRKAFVRHTLPFHMMAMDGKADGLPSWDGPYAQKHQPEDGVPYGVLRTVTSVLVTAPGKPCIDVSPIPAVTNEMGHFERAFGELVARFGPLFTLVSDDAGANRQCAFGAKA